VISCDDFFDRDDRLLGYLRTLAPGYLRFGDMPYFYAGVGDGDAPGPSAGDANVTVTLECFDRVARFAMAAGFDIYLLGNTQYGTRMHTSDCVTAACACESAPLPPATYHIRPDWTNLRHLLEHAKAEGYRVGAVDISGEANAIPARSLVPHLQAVWPAVLANATRELNRVLTEVYPDSDTATSPGRPKLVGPMLADAEVCGVSGTEWLEQYLRGCGADLDAISFDFYPMNSLDFQGPGFERRAAEAMMAPAWHDRVAVAVMPIVALRDRHAPQAQLWLTETASSSGGGIEGVSDCFASGFWYVAQLGYLASVGFAGMHREQLWDGLLPEQGVWQPAGQNFYGLLRKDYTPAPDLYTHQLWQRFVGNRVLAAAVSRGSEDGAGGDASLVGSAVRAYAHCTRGGNGSGGITLVLVNLLPTTAVLELVALPATPRVEYVFTVGHTCIAAVLHAWMCPHRVCQ